MNRKRGVAILLTLFSLPSVAQTTTTISHQNGIDPETRDGVNICTSFPFASCAFSVSNSTLSVGRADGDSFESVLEFWLSDSQLPGAPDVATLPSGPFELLSAELVLRIDAGGDNPVNNYGNVVYLNDLRTPTGNPRLYRFEDLDDGDLVANLIGLEGPGTVISLDVTSAVEAALAAGDQWLALGLTRTGQIISVAFESEAFPTAEGAPALIVTTASPVADTDGDGLTDDVDNCTLATNADQIDSNGDGFGNVCDADLNDDCVVNTLDLGLIQLAFFSAGPDADFNGDGVVNPVDLGVMKSAFFDAPGPSGLASCD